MVVHDKQQNQVPRPVALYCIMQLLWRSEHVLHNSSDVRRGWRIPTGVHYSAPKNSENTVPKNAASTKYHLYPPKMKNNSKTV